VKRKTIAKEISTEGIGLHKGQNIKLRLLPADEGHVLFRRTDLKAGENEVSLDLANTFDLTRGTNLKNPYGAAVYTIEHFLSSLMAAGITDLVVELDGNELPIGDGSASGFLALYEKAGIRELEAEADPLVITSPVYLRQDDKMVAAFPWEGFKITYAIRFERSWLQSELAEFEIDYETYKKEIAPARTFGFDYEIDYLKKNHLALGGSLENAIVITKEGVMNPEGLRFPDEFVRHKMLDIIGDLKILNRPIRGHIVAIKAGHAIDIAFAEKLRAL